MFFKFKSIVYILTPFPQMFILNHQIFIWRSIYSVLPHIIKAHVWWKILTQKSTFLQIDDNDNAKPLLGTRYGQIIQKIPQF